MDVAAVAQPREAVEPSPGQTRQPLVDDEGNPVVLSLDIKFVKPYKTQDEYLYAMKEDLAEWFNALYDILITVDDFFEQLETGVVLCQHANALQNFIAKQVEEKGGSPVVQGHRGQHNNNRYPVQLPESPVVFRSRVQPGTFQSRDNVSNFITWCRRVMRIPNTLLFETEDLVSRKNERNVVLCVLEVARRGASYGMLAPKLVQFEAEIEAEMAMDAEGQGDELDSAAEAAAAAERERQERLAKESNLIQQQANLKRQKPWIEVDMMSLDEMVRLILSECTCEHQFPMVRVSEGKYRYGEALSLIFLRILRNHVMVRIGGGWDTLECFLDRYDPCRCKSKEHRGTRAFVTKASTVHGSESSRRSSTSPMSPTATSSVPEPPPPPSTHSSCQEISQSINCNFGSPKKSSSAVEISSEEKSDPSKTDSERTSVLRSKPSGPLHSKKPLEPRTDAKKPETNLNGEQDPKPSFRLNSAPDIRTASGPRRTPSPLASGSEGHQQTKGQGQGPVIRGSRLNEGLPANTKPVSLAKKPDPRPSSASPSLTRANRTFSSSGDLVAPSEKQRMSLPRAESPIERRSLCRTGSTSSLQRTSVNLSRTGSTSSLQRTSVNSNSTRGRSATALGSQQGAMRRSSSMDSAKVRSKLSQLRPAVTPNPQGTHGARRPQSAAVPNAKSGPNVILSKAEVDRRRSELVKRNQLTRSPTGSAAQRINGTRLGFTADQLLPSYHRRRPDDPRSCSVDASPTDDDDPEVLPGEGEGHRMTRSASLEPTVSFTLLQIDLLGPPPPPEDENLNARMELLYEQYRNIELGSGSRPEGDVDQSNGKKVTSVDDAKLQTNKKTMMMTASQRRQSNGGGKRSPHRTQSRNDGVELDERGCGPRAVGHPGGPSKASKPAIRPASSPADRECCARANGNLRPFDRIDGRRGSFETKGLGDQFLGRTPRSSSEATGTSVSSSGCSGTNAATTRSKTLSRSRESVLDRSAPVRRTPTQNLCRSLGDISDRRLVLKTAPSSTEKIPTGSEEAAEGTRLQEPAPGSADADLPRAKPRRDDRLGPPTKIPLPVRGAGDQQRRHGSSSSLKRFDSGVDITNISPTGENAIYPGSYPESYPGSYPESYPGSYPVDVDPSTYRPWPVNGQCTEAFSLSDQKLAYASPPTVAEEEFY